VAGKSIRKIDALEGVERGAIELHKVTPIQP
jgi:hypothetical protein